ncbi:uncharacterized protein LOC144114919 [Amblyomma americanum]
MDSVGAAEAAMSGRGNQVPATEEYQVILPTLPTGRLALNTVFLQADTQTRPYRVEDFRDMLARQSMLTDVLALGAYRMSHVWAVTFKDAEATKKMVSLGEVKVKQRRCVVIDPANQGTRIKVQWLLHTVPDEDVRVAFAPYGKVTEVSKERWRVQEIADNGSTTRLVTLILKAGTKLEDLPHQMSIAGELALVVVAGRQPLCLRCRSQGHIRRDCRVPRCNTCRRFGRTEEQCVRTYANAVGVVSGEDNSELFMDEADAEEVAKTAGNNASKVVSPAPPLEPTTELETLVETPRAQASGADNSANSKETVSDTNNVPVITQSQQHETWK